MTDKEKYKLALCKKTDEELWNILNELGQYRFFLFLDFEFDVRNELKARGYEVLYNKTNCYNTIKDFGR